MPDGTSDGVEHISRREALKRIARGVGALLLAGSLKNSNGQPDSAPQVMSAEQKVRPDRYVWMEQGVRMWENYRGQPTKWTDAASRSGTIDLDPNAKSFGARVETQSAQQTGIEVLPAMPLPTDVVTDENLATRGIEIIGSANVDLFIREGAFAPGGLLADYQSGSNHKITIVLTDSPVLLAQGFADSRYDALRPIVDKFGRVDANSLQQMKDMAARDLKNLQNRIIDEDRTHLLAAINALSEADAIRYGIYPATQGYYLPPGNERGLPDRALIFLAVGKLPDQISFVTGDGTSGDWQYRITSLNPEETFHISRALSVNAADSYPDPERFPTTGDNSGIFAAIEPDSKTLGFVARHELGHDYKWNLHPSGIPEQDDHEGDTDLWALASITAAYTKYTQHQDDSGYSLVFRDKSTGQTVITKNILEDATAVA